MTICCISLTCGYVENALNSHLIMVQRGPNPPKTKREAMESLAMDFLEVWLRERKHGVWAYRDCCKQAQQNPEIYHCPKCGQAVRVPPIDREELEDFASFIYQFASGTTVEVGDEFRNWWAWCTWDEIMSLPKEETMGVDENGEWALIAVLNPEKVPAEVKNALIEHRKLARLDWAFEDWHGQDEMTDEEKELTEKTKKEQGW